MFKKLPFFIVLTIAFLSSGICLEIKDKNYILKLGANWSHTEDEWGDSVIINDVYSLDIEYFDNKDDRDANYEIGKEVLTGFGGVITEGGNKNLGKYPVNIKNFSISILGQTSVGRIYLIDSPNGNLTLTLSAEASTIPAAIVTEIENAISEMSIIRTASLAGYEFNISFKPQTGNKTITFDEDAGISLLEAFTLAGTGVKVQQKDKHSWTLPNITMPVIIKVTGPKEVYTHILMN